MYLIQGLQPLGVTRIQYANKDCKEIWEKKIQKAEKLYPQLEVLTVQHDIRKCMIAHHIDPYHLEGYTRYLSKKGLMILPLQREGKSTKGFSHASGQYVEGEPFFLRCVVTKTTELAEEFLHASMKNDHIKIGKLLGYPDCCSSFFDDVWGKGYIDPIWQQAENTEDIRFFDEPDELYGIHQKRIRIKSGFHEIASVFRYIGVRLTSHIPCSFTCRESLAVAHQWIDLAKQLKIEGLSEALEILHLPFEWDCLKGAAIVSTPVFKIVTDSVPCFPRYVVQKESDSYPKEAPSGLKFPWKHPMFRD